MASVRLDYDEIVRYAQDLKELCKNVPFCGTCELWNGIECSLEGPPFDWTLPEERNYEPGRETET